MTRIEFLTVGLIVGVIGFASAVAVNTAREQTRDVTRLAHVRELQIGLELYFNDHAAYPAVTALTPLGRPTTGCLSASGFGAPCAAGSAETTYIEFVPAPPAKGLKGRASCGGVNNAYCYAAAENAFAIQFELEKSNNLLKLRKGLNCATEAGFKAGACPVLIPVTE